MTVRDRQELVQTIGGSFVIAFWIGLMFML